MRISSIFSERSGMKQEIKYRKKSEIKNKDMWRLNNYASKQPMGQTKITQKQKKYFCKRKRILPNLFHKWQKKMKTQPYKIYRVQQKQESLHEESL